MECNPSVKFLIIGFGERTKNILDQIKSKNYPGVHAFDSDSYHIFPEECDKMIILINPSQKDLINLSKSFYQAGVLTLVISSKDFSNIENCFDSFTKVPQSNIIPTISGLLEPLFHFGPISFDFNDIYLTLKDSGRFKVNSYTSNITENRLVILSDEIFHELKELNFENLSLILSYNNESQKPLQPSEVENFQIFLKSLSDNINLIWGVQNDEKLMQDQIKVTTIFSGKNLKF